MDFFPASSPSSVPARRGFAVPAAIFIFTFFLFWLSPILQMGDSRYTLLLTQSLLTRGTASLDGYGIPRHPIYRLGSADLDGSIDYQVEIVTGHFYNFFPPGSGILSAPFVLVADCLGYSIDPGGAYSVDRERSQQHCLASLLMAGLAITFYRTARLLLPVGWSVGVALGGTLGTQVWSTASRALWTHTWGVALLGYLFYLLLARETGRRRLNPVLLGTLLSWTYFVRPTNSVFILAVTVYVTLFHRRMFLAYAATGAAWFAAFVAYSRIIFGKLLPSYYQANRLETNHFREAIIGNLISPSRGTLVFVPVTLFVVYLLLRHGRRNAYPRLVWLALLAGAAHLAAVSCFNPWYGGECYGPRYTTELTPIIVLLAVLGLQAVRRRLAQPGVPSWATVEWRIALAAGAALLLVSVAINARGAVSWETEAWNEVPDSVDIDQARIWDWRYPQMLAGLVPVSIPFVCPPMNAPRILFGGDAGKRFLWTGWSYAEKDFCWTEGHEATLIFGTNHTSAESLRLSLLAHLLVHKLDHQHVILRLNGRQIGDFSAEHPDLTEYEFPLPPKTLRQHRNVLVFELPDAASPRSLGENSDGRLLGIAVGWLELGPGRPPAVLPPG